MTTTTEGVEYELMAFSSLEGAVVYLSSSIPYESGQASPVCPFFCIWISSVTSCIYILYVDA